MDMKKTTNLEFEVTREVNTMKKFLKIMLIIIGAISLIFVALIGIGLFVDVEYDDHIENGRYTYVPEEENKDNEYVEFTINFWHTPLERYLVYCLRPLRCEVPHGMCL